MACASTCAELCQNASFPEASFQVKNCNVPSAVNGNQLILDEQPKIIVKNPHKKSKQPTGPSFHEKKDKNKKEYNLSGGQKIKLKKAKKYRKPITKGSKRKK